MADDTRYAYAVARVRGMETRLLDRQWIERLRASAHVDIATDPDRLR